MAKSPAWQRKAGKSPSGGLNEAGRRSARAQGMNLKRPVSAKQAKRSPKAAARRKSFCARMSGMKKKLTSSKTARDPNSPDKQSLTKMELLGDQNAWNKIFNEANENRSGCRASKQNYRS